MSYDLSIYGTTRIGPLSVVDLVQSIPILTTIYSGDDESGVGMVRVSRGAPQGPGFTIDGPFAVEDEDIPLEVTARILGVKWLYRISVEDVSDKTMGDANRISRKLTKAASGILVDEQTGQVWPKSNQRQPPRPKAADLVDEIKLKWCYQVEDAPHDLAARYLRLARQYFPEALPRRYGSSEPFQGNLERDGDAHFIRTLDVEAATTTYTVGKYPVTSGSLVGRKKFAGNTRFISLSVDRATFRDPLWREALMKYFDRMAVELGCFFASVEVLRPGRSSHGAMFSQMHEEGYYPADYRGQWYGLPPYPVWCSWYAKPYAELVHQYLPGASQNPDGSLFHSWQEESADRDQLRELLTNPDLPWIPAELSQQQGEPIQRAAVIPAKYAN